MNLVFAVTGCNYFLNSDKNKVYDYEEISECVSRFFKYERKDFRIFTQGGVWLKKCKNIGLDKPFFVYIHPKKELELDLSKKLNFRTLIINQQAAIGTALINYRRHKKKIHVELERFLKDHTKEIEHYKKLLSSSENDVQILETTPLPRFFQNNEQTEGKKNERLFLIDKFSQNGVVLRNQIEELRESMKQILKSNEYHKTLLRNIKEGELIRKIDSLLKHPENRNDTEAKKIWEKNVEISRKTLQVLASSHRIINELIRYKEYFSSSSSWKTPFTLLSELHFFPVLVKSAQCERYRRFEAASLFSSSEKRRRKRFTEWTQRVLQFESTVLFQLFPDLVPSKEDPSDETDNLYGINDLRLMKHFNDLGWTEQSQERYVKEMERFDRRKRRKEEDETEEEDEEEDEGEEDEEEEPKSPISLTVLSKRERSAYRRVQDLERQCQILSGQVRDLSDRSRTEKTKKQIEIALLKDKMKEYEEELSQRQKSKMDKLGELNLLISKSFEKKRMDGDDDKEEEEELKKLEEENRKITEEKLKMEEEMKKMKGELENCKHGHVNEMQRVMKEKLDLEKENENLRGELRESETNVRLILDNQK